MILFCVQPDTWINLDQVLEVGLLPNTKTRCQIKMVNDRVYQVNEKLSDLVVRMNDVAAGAAAQS